MYLQVKTRRGGLERAISLGDYEDFKSEEDRPKPRSAAVLRQGSLSTEFEDRERERGERERERERGERERQTDPGGEGSQAAQSKRHREHERDPERDRQKESTQTDSPKKQRGKEQETDRRERERAGDDERAIEPGPNIAASRETPRRIGIWPLYLHIKVV